MSSGNSVPDSRSCLQPGARPQALEQGCNARRDGVQGLGHVPSYKIWNVGYGLMISLADK